MSDIAKLVQEARATAARYFHAGSTSTDDLAASIDRLADALETSEAQAAALRAELARVRETLHPKLRECQADLAAGRDAKTVAFFMHGAVRRDWVRCPICGEPDMRCEEDAHGNALIICVNHACASNGGRNASAMQAQQLANGESKAEGLT